MLSAYPAAAQESAPSSTPESLTVAGNKLYFSADDGIHGREIWVTDGEPGHAHMISDVWPGTKGSEPANFYALGGLVLFQADSIANTAVQNSNGRELWVTDGTPEGTLFLKDIEPGGTSRNITWMAQHNGIAYMEAGGHELGQELWQTDGTPTGTHMVADLWTGSNESKPAQGGHAWITNGRLVYLAFYNAQTYICLFDTAKDKITPKVPVQVGSHVLGAIGNEVLFNLYDDRHGWELWRSDTTPQGTALVTDIFPGPKDGGPGNFYVFGSQAVFSARDTDHGTELWVTDGTAQGTRLLKDLNPDAADSAPYKFTASGKYIFFVAAGPNVGREIWRTDGTADGTILLQDINPGPAESEPYDLTDLNGLLIFAARTADKGEELWASDGTPQGTRLVKDIYPGNGAQFSSSPYRLVAMGRYVYFHATTQENGVELWRTDGTEAGTILVDDIFKEVLASPSSSPHEITPVGEILFFVANDFEHGMELWRTNVSFDNAYMLQDIFPGTASSSPHDLTNVNGVLYFGADDGTHGDELWKSNGTAAGTAMVKDYAKAADHAGPKHFAVFNNTLFFAAWREENGEELCKLVDNTIDCICDIAPGPASSNPRDFVAMGSNLFFRANDGTHGEELWVTNGESYGTRMVYDLLPRVSMGSKPRGLTAIEHRLFFAANDDDHGIELWSVDGSSGRPRLVADIADPQSIAPLIAPTQNANGRKP